MVHLNLQSKLNKLMKLIMLRFVEGDGLDCSEVLPGQPGGSVQAAIGGGLPGGVQPGLKRSAEEIQRRLAEKDSELGRAEGEVDMRELQQEVMDKEEEEVSRSQVMKRKRDQPLESEETRNEREHGLKQHLSLGVLEDMHKDAGTIFKSPMVQMVGKVMRDGKLESLSLNDGKNIEH